MSDNQAERRPSAPASGEVEPTPGASDRVRASVLVRVPPHEAFALFTERIDAWWKRGVRFRHGGARGLIHLEPRLGGRLFDSFDSPSGEHGAERVIEVGRVLAWEPPGGSSSPGATRPSRRSRRPRSRWPSRLRAAARR